MTTTVPVPTIEQMTNYAETLRPWAHRLVEVVHEEDSNHIGAVLAAVRRMKGPVGAAIPVEAVAVILAALVDPTQPEAAFEAWFATWIGDWT